MTGSERQVVMVVDDEEPFRRIAAKGLEPLGCEVMQAASASEALEAARKRTPDLILLDVMLQGVDGLETCRRLSSEESLRDVPIVFVTSKRDFQARLDGLAAGAIDFITKPFLMAEFQARVKTHLRMRSLHKEMMAYREALKEKEKAESLRTFAVGLGHNFNNLLTAGLGFLGLVLEDESDAKNVGHLRHVELALKRMCSLARQLLAFTEDMGGPRKTVELRRVLHNALTLFDPVALKSRVAIVCDFHELDACTILCDEFQLTQAILHILHNARESVEGNGGRIFFRAHREGGWGLIEILDFGGGMAPEVLDRIRDPFYSTKPDVGRGLGLTVAEGILRGVGGELDMQSTLGVGTTAKIRLPVTDDPTEERPVLSGEFESGMTILVAVDAEETRDAIEAMLVSEHFYVHAVDTFEGLEEALKDPPGRIDAVIVDLLRGELFGDELIEWFRERSDLPVVNLISTPHEAPSEHASLVVLQKPFTSENLLEALRRFPQLVHYG